MGVRRLAWVLLLAACPAKSTGPVTTSPPVTTADRGSAGAARPTPEPAPTPAAPALPESNATLADVGLDASSLDRTADPCVDFYQFACGGWQQATQIPPGYGSWERTSELADKNTAVLQAILEDAAKTPGNQLGDYFTSCMDEAGIEKLGLAGIKPLLAKAQAVKDAKSWFVALAELHEAGIPVVWSPTAAADPADGARYVTWLGTDRLASHSPELFVAPELAPQVSAFQHHVQRMLGLAGVAKPDVAAADVVAVETALAKLAMTAQVDTAFDLQGLSKQARSIDWKAYFKGLGITPSTKIIVTKPALFAGLDKLRKDLKPAQWASYFTYHVLSATAPALPKAVVDEWLSESGVAQQQLQQPRSKYCVWSTGESLGDLLGKQFADKTVPADAKQTAVTIYDALVKSMSDELGTVDWMTAPTRTTAQAKLAKIIPMVGYPDTWRAYDFVVKRDDFTGNVLRARVFETKRVLAMSGKPYNRSEWPANTFDASTQYRPRSNTIAVLAGSLQPPLFGAPRGVAVNLGGIGTTIGRELTHAVDDRGARFDGNGIAKNWWTPEDTARFEAKGRCVSDQYSAFEVLPKQYVDGKRTLGENIADLGGTKLAFQAYRALRKDAPPIIADGFSEDQQFFLAMAQVRCEKPGTKETQQLMLQTSPYAPDKFRVYGALRNLPAFADAFSCAQGTPMRPTTTCSVW